MNIGGVAKGSFVMTSARTFSLLAGATVLSGWLAGSALERSAVGMRVWLTMGVESWAQFSQGSDFGTGLTMDAVVGVLAAALIFAAAVSAAFERDGEKATPAALIVALVFSLLGLMLTAKAVNLIQLLAASQPAADLRPIFSDYLIWGVDFRAAAASVAFVAVVWALLGLSLTAAPETSGIARTPSPGEKVEGAAASALPEAIPNRL
jgi:hypothetical protein